MGSHLKLGLPLKIQIHGHEEPLEFDDLDDVSNLQGDQCLLHSTTCLHVARGDILAPVSHLPNAGQSGPSSATVWTAITSQSCSRCSHGAAEASLADHRRPSNFGWVLNVAGGGQLRRAVHQVLQGATGAPQVPGGRLDEGQRARRHPGAAADQPACKLSPKTALCRRVWMLSLVVGLLTLRHRPDVGSSSAGFRISEHVALQPHDPAFGHIASLQADICR